GLCLISVNQRMKANHNPICCGAYVCFAVPNISKSKNESKSQHRLIRDENQQAGKLPSLCLISVNQRMKANHNEKHAIKKVNKAVPNISKSKNESKSQLPQCWELIVLRCA